MPLYEYTCDKCQEDFELLIRAQESPECPSCGNQKLEKLFSVPAAHSAGSSQLPMCNPPSPAGCGMPQCGTGRCAMD